MKFFNNRGQRSKDQAKRRASASSPLKPRRLMTEALEERQLLAVGVLGATSAAVSETANIINVSNVVSIDAIKQAIAEAATTQEDDVIQISPATLQFASASDEITINIDSSVYGSITIEAGDVTIDANSLARAFSIKNGDVTLRGITIVNGSSDYGGAIANDGDLTLDNVTLTGNVATTAGGAIANSGALYIQDSIITDSSSNGAGAAIYEGDFSWPSAGAPEWSTVPDQVGSKGTTLNVDLTQYVNTGNWTYAVTVADSTSSILASNPTVSDSGILSLSFVGDDAYYGEDDYSPVVVTVTAADGANSASTTFQVSLAEQTSVTLAAVLSNMTYEDAKDEYLHGTARRPTGYACDDGIPSPSVVDVSDSLTVQVWLQDFDWVDYAGKVWDAGDYAIMGVQYTLHLENAIVTEFTPPSTPTSKVLMRDSFVHKDLGDGNYSFIVAYTGGANFGYEEALLLDVLTIEAIDPSQPVSATIYQNGTDWKDPCLTRMYGEPIERDPSRSHINVDPSQTLFVSTISNSAEPLSSVPGQPFDTNISRAELDSETVDVSSASLATAKSLTISNSLIAANSGSGSGAIYIAEDGTAALYNVTLANNSANDAAVYYAGANSSAVTIANAIIVNNATSPLFGVASAPGSLVDASGVANATVYSGGTLFTNAESGDYSLASGSEASNIGVDAQALDVYGNVLSVDLAGANRFSGTVDAGAYEFQGAAPAAPTNVTISDYVESNKAPVLSWTASTSSDVLAYNVYQIDGNNKTVVATVNTTSFADLSSVVSIADNQLYTFGVAAVSEYGVSSIATVKLNTVVAPAAPKNVAFSEYTGGASATLTWTASKNATGYKIEALNASNKWVTVGTVTETSYVATVEENATYSYRVSAFTTVDSVSKYSKTVKADLNTVVAPAAPTNVAFAEYAGGTSATLTWDASENASGYLVETLNASNVWETVGTVTETSYVATVEENATYSYRVSAFTTVDSETKYSTTIAADLNTVVAPAAPKNVKFAEYTGGTSATLTWTASKNATGYKIEALNASNKWVTVGTVTGTSYVATVEENADYSYRVSAYTTVDSVSKYSKTVKADLSTLLPPSGTLDLAVSNYDSVAGTARLSWTALDYADHYVVYGQTNGGEWTTLADSVTNSPYTLTGIVANTSYAFRVAAVNAAGVGTTEDVSFDATLVPSTPADAAFGALDAGNNSIAITWSPVPNATGYIVQTYNNETDAWDVVDRDDDAETFYVVKDLVEDVPYAFAISAYNDAGVSEPTYLSYVKSPIPDAPANLSVVYNKPAKSANISWKLSEGAEGYNVYQQFGVGSTWKKIATMSSISNEYTVQNLEPNALYYFAVSAWNESGESEYSIAEILTDVSLDAPTEFTVDSYDAETHRATMSWVDNAIGETGYEVQYSLDNETWLTAATLAPNANSRVAKGLTPGKTYYFRVAAFDDYGYSAWATTTFDVPAEVPAAPSDIVFSNYDSDAKTLLVSWTDNSDDEVGFRVQYSTDQQNWNTTATTEADVTSYTAVGLVPGRTYYYRVAAVGPYGVSEYSDVASYTVESTTVDVPAAPSDIKFSNVEFTSNGVNATMSWTDNSDNEDRFVIQFSYDNENWLGAGSTDANVTTRTATGLVSGKTYYFRVAAYNAAGYSDWATTTYDVPTAVINKPGDIVFGEYSSGNLEMSWADNSDNEDGFVIQFSYDGEKWNRAGTTEANVNYRTATRVSPGRTYYFRVAAFKGSSYSDWSYGEYTAPSGVPTEPGKITFTNYSAENHTVEMSWVDNSNDETGFRIEYSTDSGATWRTSAQTSADVNYRTATALRVGETYQFRVRSFNAFGSSGWTYGSYAVPTADGSPAAPTDFVFGDYDPVTRTLGMSWTDVADNETGYKVQYSVDGGAWCFAGTYDANVTSRTATAVLPGRTYTFRVAAYNDAGNSSWLVSDVYDVSDSNFVPAAPTGLVFGNYDAARQTLPMSWNDNSSNEKGFMVEYSIDGGTTWKVSEYLGADATSRTASRVYPGREYSFRVSAYNNYGVSDYAVGSFSTATIEDVAAPTNLAFSYSTTKRQIAVTWSGDASGYNAQYKPSDATEWYNLTVNGRTATLNNVTYGSMYNVRVQSIADDGALSAWTVDSFDTVASESGATDDSGALLAEAFADFFNKDFFDIDV